MMFCVMFVYRTICRTFIPNKNDHKRKNTIYDNDEWDYC